MGLIGLAPETIGGFTGLHIQADAIKKICIITFFYYLCGGDV
jgi:hypothetical protein